MFFGPFSAIFFASYEKMKDLVLENKDKPTLTESIICSSTAGAFAGWITTPLELVKLRMQIQRADISVRGGSMENSIFGYKNAFHGLYLIAKNEGLLALYKGALLRVCFSVPMTTISLSLTELFRQKLLESNALESFI